MTPDCVLEQVGEKLRLQRLVANKKMAVVEQVTGISHAVLSKIENGKHWSISLQALILLCNYYGLELPELFS